VANGTIIRVRLDGFDTLRARLDYFPDRMRNNFLRGGARAAASLLAKRLKTRLSSDGLQTAAGSVRSSVRLQGGPAGNTVRGVVQYGGRYQKRASLDRGPVKTARDAWYAHILEWGARPHVIKPRPGRRALMIRGAFVSKVRHPGIRARLYATQTAERDMPAANAAFERYVEARVARFWSTGR
jgi:hypothetical protein